MSIYFRTRFDVEGKKDAILLWIDGKEPKLKHGVTLSSPAQVDQLVGALLAAKDRIWGWAFDPDTDDEDYEFDPTIPVGRPDAPPGGAEGGPK